jgi:sialic acid synthase SpsE|tara:strand:+ start:358 stop:1377 length:1020 start_codon:yes stop_codon:yes gene_type:complete
MKSFKIKNKKIGNNQPAFVIAEVGLNHNGSVSQCAKLIDQAKIAGADAVKLQVSDPEESYANYTTSYKLFKKYSLKENEILNLKKYADKKKIIFFFTAGDFKSLDLVKKFKMPAIKISSGLMTNIPLVTEASKMKVPIIISTGMCFEKEIIKTLEIAKKNNKTGVALLKCTSLYPASDNTINLLAIRKFISNFQVPIGYSDHTVNNLACLLAIGAGAKIIEKHFTLNNKQKGLDHKMSSEPKDFKELVRDIRRTENLMGKDIIGPHFHEIKQRSKNFRSILATKKIYKNKELTFSNIALKRTSNYTTSLSSKYFYKVLGKRAKMNIQVNEKILFKKIKK